MEFKFVKWYLGSAFFFFFFNKGHCFVSWDFGVSIFGTGHLL